MAGYWDPLVLPSASSEDVHIDFHIPSRSHGSIIGERGAIINRLQSDYVIRLQVPKADVRSTKISVHGKLESVAAAIKEIETLTGYHANALPLLNAGIMVTKGAHGSFIGTGGSILKSLQKEFNCFINIPKREDSSDVISVQGSKGGIMGLVAKMENTLKQSIKIKWEDGDAANTTSAAAVSASSGKRKEKIDLSKEINEVLFFPDHRAVSTADKAGQGSATNFDKFLAYLYSATSTIDICVFTITDDRISRTIEDLHSEGVKVRIITEASTADEKGSDIRTITKVGIPIKMDVNEALMHHKFAVIDNKLVVNGSFNWTRAAATANQENVVVSSNNGLVKSFAEQFNKLWNDKEMVIVTPEKPKDALPFVKKGHE